MKSFEKYWKNKTLSGHRHDSSIFYKDKVREHLALLSDDEKKMDISDIGCGAGELLFYLEKECNIVEAVDYSQSMLDKAKKLLRGKKLNFLIFDANSYIKQTCSEVLFACGSFNQYLDKKDIENIVKTFRESSSCRSMFLFDTIDPDKYELWKQGRARYDRFFPSRKEILKLNVKEILGVFTGKYKQYMVEIGEMGYAYRPHYWSYLANQYDLDIEMVSSQKYEYRYHVILRKQEHK